MSIWREHLARTLRRDPTFRFAVLFGSEARGTARLDSDLDIALGTSRPVRALEPRLIRLAAELREAAHRDVQLVPLGDASLSLRFAVARDGVLLWARDRREFARFRASTSVEQADMEPMAARLRQAFLARVAAEARG